MEKISDDTPVETIWQALKADLADLVDQLVPTKMSSSRHSQPWVNTHIKRLCKRKERAYKKARRNQKWEKYNQLKRELLYKVHAEQLTMNT